MAIRSKLKHENELKITIDLIDLIRVAIIKGDPSEQ